MKQEISTEIKQELVKQALAARKFAYVPYSKFRVGAAVLAKNGAIYTGCNIENAAYTPTNCAERTAVFKAVSEGVTEFDAIAVCGGPGEAEPEDFCTPCGVCRQVLREFVDPNEFLVLLCKGDRFLERMTLEELLPGIRKRKFINKSRKRKNPGQVRKVPYALDFLCPRYKNYLLKFRLTGQIASQTLEHFAVHIGEHNAGVHLAAL